MKLYKRSVNDVGWLNWSLVCPNANDTFQDGIAPRRTDTPNDRVTLSAGHSLSAGDGVKESDVERDAAKLFGARELTMRILNNVHVCYKKMLK